MNEKIHACTRNGDGVGSIYDTAATIQVGGYGCGDMMGQKYAIFRNQILYSPGFGPGSEWIRDFG